MTLDDLKNIGVDTEDGMARCMNNEAFYIKMVNMFLADESKFDALKSALDAGDLASAFEQAHALKGVCANLALTPLQTRISDITELLRSHTEMDYSDKYQEVMKCWDELKALA